MIKSCSISLVMYGIKKCSGSCLYCSAASTMGYRDTENGNKKTFKLDKEKTKAKILEYTEINKILEDGDSATLHIDLWGGNPLENFEEFKETVQFCQNELKEFQSIELHTSGNGLELQSEDLVNYLIDNNIHYQLSHDGLGQWIRTGEIDPLYWDKTKDNIAKLARLGILDWINTTLNGRNYSFFANIDYWNKWRIDNNLTDKDIHIKLNHIYPGTPPVNKKWIGKNIIATYPGMIGCKTGEVIGDLNITGRAAIDYFHEFRKLALIYETPNIENSWELRPFYGYIHSQAHLWRPIDDESQCLSSCRRFQMGITDKNFAIDTLGNYCQCNLIDSSTPVKNPTGKRPPECETCKYKMQDTCYPCGSEEMTSCEFQYQFCQVLEEFAQLSETLNIINDQKSCNCNESCTCNMQKMDPIYCVKNYIL